MTVRSFFFPAVLLASLLGAALSLYSVSEHLALQAGVDLAGGFCDINATFNCRGAIESSYSELFGIPLGAFGFSFYLFLFLLSLLAIFSFSDGAKERSYNFIFVASLSSLLASAFLGFISVFEIGALCPVCLSLYGVSLLLFLIAVFGSTATGMFNKIGSGIKVIVKALNALLSWSSLSTEERRNVVRTVLVALISLSSAVYLPRIIQLPQPSLGGEETEGYAAALNSFFNEFLAGEQRELGPVVEGGIESAYRFGPADASVKIVEFFDYECPACRQMYPFIKEIQEQYPNQVSVVYKNYPLDHRCNPHIKQPFHAAACLSAEIARCAGEQGAFAQALQDLMELPEFEDQQVSGDELRRAVREMPQRLNLDQAGLEECLESDRQLQPILADIELAEKLNIAGTPSIWINGKPLPSVNPIALRYVVRRLLGEQPTLESLEKPL